MHVAAPAPDGFDARFAARHRHYRYRVSEPPGGVDPLRRLDVLDHRRPLDVDAMAEAASRLVGLHDFAAFCRRRAGATTVRTLLTYTWSRPEPGQVDAGLVVADVVADAFCHSMVRALVGALLPVGERRRDVDWPAQVLGAVVRDPAVSVVPPHGLTLERVDYPPDAEPGPSRGADPRRPQPGLSLHPSPTLTTVSRRQAHVVAAVIGVTVLVAGCAGPDSVAGAARSGGGVGRRRRRSSTRRIGAASSGCTGRRSTVSRSTPGTSSAG
ncbi:hypothetical protein GCM10025868_33150 [Angustibacter aerolatus]|uniref:tRNA pseudouridine synthase n=1 Tax=Angustibacter aerolatus TaxID=1162965 RepID=A0ABQ6JIL7_9ACTN|nr:hypothetical protein GCM10025868_33150 [Angustibacter aerolatus]